VTGDGGLDCEYRTGRQTRGTLIVALLIVTGTVNSVSLVGPDHLAALAPSTCGLLPIFKLMLFAGMVGLAG